jgi:CBS domain-containing protein
MSTPGYTALHKADLASVMKAHEVITLKESDPVDTALGVFGKHKVLSLPVTSDDKGRVVGLVDTLDILAHCVQLIHNADVFDSVLSNHKHDMSQITFADRALCCKPLGEVMGSSSEDPLISVSIHDKLTLAAQRFMNGVHRVPVLDDEDKLVSTFSQSDLVRLIREYMKDHALGFLGKKTVEDVGLAEEKIIAVETTCPILAVMHLMNTNKVSAIALVDADSKIVGNFSATDLRGLFREHLADLMKPADVFLKEHSPKSFSPLTCQKSDTLADVIDKLLDSRVHRLWVVEDNKPVGCVSLGDIIKVTLATEQ